MRLILLMSVICLAILQHIVIEDLRREVDLNKELFKSCSAELQWQMIKNN